MSEVVSIEQVLSAAQAVLEARGMRVTEVGQAVQAEATAVRERAEADAASLSEDQAITVLKDMANAYHKEV